MMKALAGFKVLRGCLAVAALAGMALAAVSGAAEARGKRVVATKVHTSYSYKVVPQHRYVTRYRDVYRTRYVTHTRRIVNVTRVQPVTRIHVVKRIRNRTVTLRSNRYATRTQMLPARHVTTGKTVHLRQGGGRDRVTTVYRYRTVQKVRNVTRYSGR